MMKLTSISFVITVTLLLNQHVIYSEAGLHEHDGNTYFISNPLQANWHEAYQHCGTKNMELLYIESKSENDFILNLVRTDPEYRRPGNHYWIGATDFESQRDWYWLSTGKHVDYSNWATDEPSPNNEHCTYLCNKVNFLWKTTNCIRQINFICKAKPCATVNPVEIE